MCVYMNFQLYGSVKQIVCFIAGQQDTSFGSHFDQQDCWRRDQGEGKW